MLTVSYRTHPGAVRPINEDCVTWEPDLSFVAIADGMGGHNAGEVASKLAIDTVRGFLQKSAAGNDFTWPFGVDPALSFAANRLMTAMKIANRRVFKVAEERAEYGGMGTTLVAGIVDGNTLTFSNVGDSRIYSFANAELRQLSRDDSWIVMLTEESGLDATAFEKHPLRHVLTKVIGARTDVDVPIKELELADGQVLMLCTDGLHGAIPADMVRSLLQSEPDLEKAAEALVALALERDGRDNITVLLARHTAG